jgi:hypothetical protein
MQGNNFDVVTGFTNGTTLHQPFSNDSAERFAPLGVQVGYNRSAGRGESNIYVGAGNASPGGFDFIKVIGISVQAPSSYDPATAIVTLTTRTPHGLVVGSRFNLSLVLGTDSIGFTDGRDISKLGGNWIATADNAGTSGTTINFVLTQNVAGVPTPYTGLDILTITAGAINASALDSGVIDTSVGLPVVVSNSGTLGFTTGGSLLSVDGYANTRLSGALVHGAIQTATLANGGTVTVPQNTSFMLVNNSSSIATGSLVLPAPAASSFQTIGSQLDVRFQNPVGTLTVTAATGAAVAGPPTAVLSAGAAFRFIQGGPGAAANTWLPCIPDVSGTPPVGGPYLALSGGAVGPGTLTVNGPFVATGSVTLPTTTTGPFLPLATGGTVAGLVNLTAAGLGLDVTGNARTRGQHIVGVAGTNNIITMTAGANQTTTPAIIQAQNSPGIAFTGGPLAANCTNFGRANTYTLSGGTIDTTLFGLYVQNGIIGNSTVPEIPGAAWINLSQANVNAPSSLVDALRVSFVAGGVAAVSGGWQALAATCSDIAPTNDKAGGGLGCFLAAQINRIASQPQGGTGLTPSTAFGNNWGIDVICTAKNGALNLYGMTGIELDNAMNTGSSVVRRAGLAVNNSGGHAVRGAMADDAIVVGQATGPPWRTGLRFGGGFSPLAPLGTDSKVLAYELSQAHTALANIGIDFNDVTFTTAALRTPGGFAVSPTGVLQLSTAFLTPTATGLSVDVVGSVGTGTPAVSAGGSGYAGLGGDILDDAYGGVYYTLASGGVVTSVTVVAQPIYPTASPPATLATTARSASTGTGCVLTPTWSTTRTTLALQPSGGTIQAGSGAWTANGATSVSLTALAPAGAHATVQEWLTIKDASGTVRYVPCF